MFPGAGWLVPLSSIDAAAEGPSDSSSNNGSNSDGNSNSTNNSDNDAASALYAVEQNESFSEAGLTGAAARHFLTGNEQASFML